MNYYGLLDENLQETVWESSIPLRITINPQDLITSNIPLTLYYNLPRISYISSIIGDIIKNFQAFIQINLSDLWIEYEGNPIKWQYPIGVIVDSLGIDISKGPINLIIRQRDMPKNHVLEYTSMNVLRFYFFSALKEADCIRYPIDKKAFGMAKDKTDKLEKIIYENNPKNIIDYRKIMDFEKQMSKYPTKLVFCRTDIVFIKAAEIIEGNEENYTIGQFLSDVLKKETYEKIKEKCKILIHGVEIEENMSFLFYYFNFSYMDTFLYIVFLDKLGDKD